MATQPAVDFRGFSWADNGLVVTGEPTLDDYRVVARELGRRENLTRWAIGDLLLSCEQRHGELYSQVADETGLNAQTIQVYVGTARRFPPARRRDLSWSHHRVLASLKDEEQDDFLNRAESERLPCDVLREIARAARGLPSPAPRSEPSALPPPPPDPNTIPCPACKGSGRIAKPDVDPGEVILTFPCTGKGPPEWDLTADMLAEWVALYPSLDVLSECRKALAWVKANPVKKRTAGGMPRFIVNWLNGAVDNPRTRHQGNGHAPQPQRETFKDRVNRVFGTPEE